MATAISNLNAVNGNTYSNSIYTKFQHLKDIDLNMVMAVEKEFKDAYIDSEGAMGVKYDLDAVCELGQLVLYNANPKYPTVFQKSKKYAHLGMNDLMVIGQVLAMFITDNNSHFINLNAEHRKLLTPTNHPLKNLAGDGRKLKPQAIVDFIHDSVEVEFTTFGSFRVKDVSNNIMMYEVVNE